MKPTMKLRFIERQVEVNGDHKPVRILQQWWEDSGWSHISKFINGQFQPNGEWRDVPFEAQ